MHLYVRRSLTLLALAAGLSCVGTAHADPDPRPSVVSGNPTSCRSAGLPGDILEVTATIRDNTYVDITAVPSGFQLTGVVVKGVRNFHKYPYLRELPWNDLQAPNATPFTGWFACAKPRSSATTTNPTTPPTTTTTAMTTAAPTTTSDSSSRPAVTTSTSTTPAAPRDDDSLAETGFSGGPLMLVGGGLLVAGGAALILARGRRRARP